MLMKQPGTFSSMYEKSSEAMISGASVTTCGAPTRSRQTDSAKSACSGSLTSGAKFTRKSTLALAPIDSATPRATRRMLASIRRMVSCENARTVPERRLVCGIAL